MNKLQSELQRLYLPRPELPAKAGAELPGLVGATGEVRAMVLELTGSPAWEHLARVWRGVQADLELRAPAIAVSGTDGLQLWFSLAEPVGVARAHGFLERLRLRYLPDIDARRVRLMPGADASAADPGSHAHLVPALQPLTGNWSAFVAPDLAPVFDDTPWLDTPPSEEGQATLLRAVGVISRTAFDAALAQLEPGAPAPQTLATEPAAARVAQDPATPVAADGDAARFLRQVMQDETVALALRIDAAKALLQRAAHRAG